MTTRARVLLPLALSVLALGPSLSGCGRTTVFPRVQKCVFDTECPEGLRCVDQECRILELVDGGPHGKRFGEPCDAGAECESSFCLGGPVGAFCTRPCDAADAGCPSSYTCKGLVDPRPGDGGARVTLCAVPQPLLCQSCATSADCGASGADECVSLSGGRFCGRDCTVESCPPLYACRLDGSGRRQCVPEGRTCDCVPATLGLSKGCHGTPNSSGSCSGNQVCQVDGGFTPCSAPPALAETCNGVDDDCNGQVDDFTPPSCTKTVGSVTCTGPQVCLASAGLVCAARAPEPEVCNGLDDDCNGKIDDRFVDDAGRYVTVGDCGQCGNDCTKVIGHAISVSCDATTATPRCRVSQCAAGYFPFDDGRLCLELLDTLCHACASDSDCAGPNSRCLIVDGARVCGRDCGAGSAYPPGCPGGYSCTAVDGGAPQCTPVTRTCSCKAATLGATRSCTSDVCRGFETCVSGADGPAWGTCDVASYNAENCDGRDNNCDGQVDEGFKNQVTGKYEAGQHCGFCNNDCTKYFSPTLQHTTGVCDVGPALPRCTMGPCLTETVGGTSSEWIDVNGETADGCECRRVLGNLASDLPDRAPSSTGGASWIDENCDGVDGVSTDAIFVSATAPAGGNGSRTAPLNSINAGLSAMQVEAKRYVLVAQGTYRENVRLFEGAQLFGGYSLDFLKRDPQVHPTQLVGVQPATGALAALHAEALGTGLVETVVAGFTIVGWDVAVAPAQGAPGEASIAVYLKDVGQGFVLESCDVVAGRGASGGRGPTGNQGFGRQLSTAVDGTSGVDSEYFTVSCSVSSHRSGGAGGSNPQCAAAGARGGDVVCPVYAFQSHLGQQQAFVVPTPGSKNGRGGWDWSYDLQSGATCSHVTESGFPTGIQPHDGDDGRPGPDGPGGLGGAGAPSRSRYGSVSAGKWVASPAGASAGAAGQAAEGGGGGGAGGGVARYTSGGCLGWQIGATGGGGAAGGCGGTGGLGGGAGGASLGLFIVSSSSGAALPTVRGNRIQRGLGGNGGGGGFGGAGGLGGAGGFGGLSNEWSGSVGGKGGEGGNGGPGGGGGGGAGGASFGVLGFNVQVSDLSITNTFLTPLTVDTGGAGGEGGSSPGASSSSGAAGARGASVNMQALWPCAPGCASGSTCDANGVCIPN